MKKNFWYLKTVLETLQKKPSSHLFWLGVFTRLFVKINFLKVSQFHGLPPVNFARVLFVVTITQSAQTKIGICSIFIPIFTEQRNFIYPCIIILLSQFIVEILFFL